MGKTRSPVKMKGIVHFGRKANYLPLCEKFPHLVGGKCVNFSPCSYSLFMAGTKDHETPGHIRHSPITSLIHVIVKQICSVSLSRCGWDPWASAVLEHALHIHGQKSCP